MRFPVVFAVAVVLSACGAPDEPAAGPSSPAPTEAPSEVQATDATATTAAVALEPEGMGVQGEVLLFEEAGQASAIRAIDSILGPPTRQESGLECGPGPLDSASWEGLDVYFSEGTLAGWYLEAPAPAGVMVSGGVGPGSTLQDLQNAFGEVSVEGSTLGTEWSGGALFGTLNDTGEVEVIWSGATCIAR